VTIFSDQLDAAAAGADPEVAALLRRAAIRLRNAEAVSIPPGWSNALVSAMADLGTTDRSRALHYIVGEWLVSNGYLPFEEMAEDDAASQRERRP
jgi:hypothetical protein